MKTRLSAIFLSLVLLCTLLPLQVSAETISGTCGENLTYTLDLETKTLTISGTGAMDDFGNDGEPSPPNQDHPNAWYRYRTQIETVLVGEGVTTVGARAFCNFSALTRVELPESLTKIGQSAFCGCAKLPEIRLPANLQQLSKYAFWKCESLQSLTLPAALTDFTPEAVMDCTGLTAIAAAEENPAYAAQNGVLFSKDGSVLVCYPGGKTEESYNVPAEVREIGDFAFRGARLRQVSLPEGLTALGKNAFALSALTEFTLPSSIAAVPEALLNFCKDLTKVTLHNGVTEIGPMAFTDCEALAELRLPEGLQSIGYYALKGCASLRELTLPEGLTAVEYNAFTGTGISSVTIPESLTALDNGLFWGCKNLTEVKLHDQITSLGADVFRDCTALESISLPEAVQSIGMRCFSGAGLKDFVFPGGVALADVSLFESCAALQTVDCTGVQRISIDAFRNCTALEQVTFGSELAEISDGAFDGCDNLHNVYYSADLEHWRGVSVGGNGNDPLLQSLLHTSDGTSTLFTDVDPDAYYAVPVAWAVESGITNGTGNGKFSPDAKCTRAQVVTFLWRAKGSPEPEALSSARRDGNLPSAGEHALRSKSLRDSPLQGINGETAAADGSPVQNPFEDIKAEDYYYNAVLWAVENGITTGTGNGKFSPNMGCTRGQVVTFLWRTEGCPEAEGSGIKDQGSGAAADGSPVQNPFDDIKADDYYFKAVLWAVENNITQGTGNGKFSPNMTCTRGQIVTFLYRDLAA